MDHHGIHLSNQFVHDCHHDDFSMLLSCPHSFCHGFTLGIVLRGGNRTHIQCPSDLGASHSTDMASRFNAGARLLESRRQPHVGDQFPTAGEAMEVAHGCGDTDGRAAADSRDGGYHLHRPRHHLLGQALQIDIVGMKSTCEDVPSPDECAAGSRGCSTPAG